MKVLIISYFTKWVPHFGTELELAQIHLDRGDTVEFLGCDGCIIACQTNPQGDVNSCNACRLRRLRGMQLLSTQPVEHQLGDYLPKNIVETEDEILSAITDAESAKAFRYRDHDLGWGALSSTIDELRDPICESPQAKELLKRLARTALRSYLAVHSFLQTHQNFDRVYIFNGRFACTRGAYRACQEHEKLEIMIHERGSSVEKYELFGATMPHSRKRWHQSVCETWEAASRPDERGSIGRAFYEGRRMGSPLNWKSFISAQQKGRLPDDWDQSKNNVVIFNSSEDEFASIGDEWINPVYPKQSEGIRRVVSDALTRYPKMHIFLRMHPNLTDVVNKDVEMLHAIKSPNFTLIEPRSSVSTYDLLDVAERVLTFGSTVGIEATYWGKVSILAGRSFYDNLDAVHVARDHEHVMELLGANLVPKQVVNALKFGYHSQTFGIPFRHWKADGFLDGSFRGVPLRWSPATRIEGHILVRLYKLGIRSITLQNFIHECSRLTVRVISGVRRRIGLPLT